jgi:hypothetical protein
VGEFAGTKPQQTFGRQVVKYLPYLAVLVFVVGGVAFLIKFYGNTSTITHPSARPGTPVDASKNPPSVPLPSTARRVAGEYIVATMARKNLPLSWKLTHPSLKKGYTYKEWLTGNIPVQFFPAAAVAGASFKVQYSHPKDVLLNVYVFSNDKKVKTQSFFIELKPVGTGKAKHWLVSYVAPSSGALMVQNAGDNGAG